MNLNREQIAIQIVATVLKEKSLEIGSINRKTHHKDNYKKGLYFLLDKDKESVIYVGRISDAKTASLYMRLIGNGKGAHRNNKDWYKKPKNS